MNSYHILDSFVDQTKILPVGDSSQTFLRRFSATGNCGEPAQTTEVRVFALAKTNRNFIYLNGDPDFIPGDTLRYRVMPNTAWSTELDLSKVIKLTLPFGNTEIEVQKRDRQTNTWPVLARKILVNVALSNIIPAKVHDVIRTYNENLCAGRRYGNIISFGTNLSKWSIVSGNLYYLNGITSANLFIDLDKYEMLDPLIINISDPEKDTWTLAK